MHPLQKKYKTQIEEMVCVCHELAAARHVTSHGGNLSWRVSENEILITPTKVAKGRMAFEHIVIVAPDRSVLCAEGGMKPTGEIYTHLLIYGKRPDARSVIHAHSPWLTALALSKPELMQKAFLPEPAIEVGPVAVTDYAAPISEALAATFEPFLEKHNAFLMRNHGVIALCVEGIRRCFDLLEMLETTAKTVAVAEMLGGARPLTRQQISELTDIVRARGLPMPGLPGRNTDLGALYEL